MTLKNTSIVLLSLFVINFAYTQEPKTDNVLGSNYVFHSEVTGEQQQLQVYLPESYIENSTIKYPVLYLLDGQNWYTFGVSLLKVFTGSETDYKSIPDFIVVGITTNWEKRREFFGSNNKNNAINFIENEVIAFIDKNFRTSTERILFGWQFAGGFVINTLAEKPELFNGYLAATPVFFDPKVIDNLLSEHKNLNSFLYVAGTKEEESTWVKPMADILTKKAPKTFDWTYKKISAFGAFGHRISPVETISYGLRAYFHDYPLLEFENVNSFYKKGGMNYVKEYYKKRAERYSISEDLGYRGMYLLFRLALRENHYPTFALLANEFKDTGFFESLGDWQLNSCAEFYLNHNKPDKAINLFNLIIKNNPENARTYNGLGNAYLEKRELKKAVEFYKKAIEFAEKNNDGNLDKYKTDLNKVNKKLDHVSGKVVLDPENSKIKSTLNYTLAPSHINSDTLKFIIHNGLKIDSLKGKNIKYYDIVPANNLFGISKIPFTNFIQIVTKDSTKPLEFDITYQGTIPTNQIIFGPGAISRDWIELNLGSAWFPLNSNLQTKLSHNIQVDAPAGYKIYGIENQPNDIDSIFHLNSSSKNIDIIIIGAKDLKSKISLNNGMQTEFIYTADRNIEDINRLTLQASRTLEFLNKKFNTKILKQRIVLPPNRPRVREEGYSRYPFIMLNHNPPKDSLQTFKFIAHETAHYWWNKGNTRNQNNFLNESLAEYSYLIALREFYGEDYFLNTVKEKIDYLNSNNLPSLFESEKHPNLNYDLFYRKGPVALYNLENKIGKESLIRIFQENLNSTEIEHFISSVEKYHGSNVSTWFKSIL